MTVVRKFRNGDYYLTRHPGGSGKRTEETLRNWWFIKHNTLNLQGITFPKELEGKRVRFKIEVIEDE